MKVGDFFLVWFGGFELLLRIIALCGRLVLMIVYSKFKFYLSPFFFFFFKS